MLEGQLRFKLGVELRDASAGTFVFVPRGTAHCFQNVGGTAARVLVLFTPSGMERFFERLALLPNESTELDAFRTIGREVYMDVVGPPLAISNPHKGQDGPARTVRAR